MKILYSEGDFLESRHQIIAYPASVGGDMKLDIEKDVTQRHPDVKQCVFNMFAENENYDVVPPLLGDVIWTHTSGNKWIAHMIIFDERNAINYDALALCMKSIKKKAIELDQEQIGIPMRWFPDKIMMMNWIRTYETIEDTLSEDGEDAVVGNFQVFAYDRDSEYVKRVVESLPGQKRAFYSDVKIQFRKF